MSWRRCALLMAHLVVSMGLLGCATRIERPGFGRCDDANPSFWAKQASASLRTAPYVGRRVYDVAASGRPVAFRRGDVPADSRAVVSYPAPGKFSGGPAGFERLGNRSFVYDNALFVLLRTWEGSQDQARQVLQTLVALQRPDGAWGFSFNIEGDGFYNAGYVRTGAVAWVTYAFALYTVRFGDRRFVGTLRKAGQWLIGQVDGKTGLLRGGQGKWGEGGASFEPMYEADWASTEHNVDAYFAIKALAQADPASNWPRRLSAERLARTIQGRLFMPVQGRYAQGLQPAGLDKKSALDAAGTWSALFEIDRGRPAVVDRLLAWVDQRHGIDVDGWRGYLPYADDDGPEVWFVEGSVARAIALHRRGRREEALAMVRELSTYACASGVPLAYANRWAKDFPLSPAVAPTVWYVLAVEEIWNHNAPFLWPTVALP